MILPSKAKAGYWRQIRHKSIWRGVIARLLCYRVGMSTRYSLQKSRALPLRWFTAAAAASLGLCVFAALSPGSAAASPLHSGPVDVLSAGSLQDLLQQQVAPAFQAATGYTLNNTSMGSDAIASGIKGGTLQGDVFISASPEVNKTLEGSTDGNWVSWYASFGSSPLVLGYNPSSKFAGDLRTKPWYDVIDQPSFLIGRTDPATDPKGVLAVTALDQAAKAHDIPALKAIASSTSNVYPETSLVGQLQAGQLDAGFFYGVEAAAADIKTVPLSGTKLAGVYTITILNRAPHEAAARAFVAFLLGKDGQRILAKNGIVAITPPKASGKSSVPTDLKGLLSR
jgi:molybdate/tungstate transport system substrate-binding protein